MSRSILAGAALLLSAAVAAPVVAWSADNPPAPNQAAPAEPGAAVPGPGMPPPGVMRPGMMGRGGWRHHMMMGGMGLMARQSPRERCINRMARRAGMIAYTLTKLNLAPQQHAAWAKVEAALRAAGDRQRHVCDTLPAKPGAWKERTILDRLARREQAMSAHLQDLQQLRPAMEQFYHSLTPAQQAILNHPFHSR
jgi:hypothetical protein